MSEIPMHLPKSFSTERSKLEKEILDFSNKIFKNIKFGFAFVLLINGIYLYNWYYKMPLIATFIFFYFLFLVSHTIIYQFKGNK